MRIHAVPQWQGSGAPGADRLAQGCQALAGLAAEVLGERVEIVGPQLGRSATVDGVAHRDVLVTNRTAQLAALEVPEAPVLTIGGDCGVELVPVGVARYRHGEGLGVVWFDAHADLNTAGSSPSGAFHGMVLRSLFGEGDADFAADPALAHGRGVLAGTRAFDEAERAAVDAGLVRHVAVAECREPERIAAAVRESGATKVYLHVDLDVLDPAEFGGVGYPEPDGLTIDELVAGIRGLDAFDVVGAGITECLTDDPGRLRGLAPVLAAVGALLAR